MRWTTGLGAVLTVVAGLAAPAAHAFGLAETAAATGIATGLAGSRTSAVSATFKGMTSNLNNSVGRRNASMNRTLAGVGLGRGPSGGIGQGGWLGSATPAAGQNRSWATTSSGLSANAGWVSASESWQAAGDAWDSAQNTWPTGGGVSH